MASNKQTVITRPTARSEELLIQHVDSETVAYDERTKTAHALRPLAAAVFMYADGNNTVEEIAELASYRLDQAVTPAEVSEAVEQLDACDLLDTPAGILSGGVSRRTALKTLAAAGAGTMLVSSIAAPFASAASTALGNFGTGYTCAYVSNNGNYIVGSGGYDSDPAATGKGVLTPDGWPIPYGLINGTGNANSTSAKFGMASDTTTGGPVTPGNYVLGASCYAVYSKTSPVYGTYQAVPCDGPTWECANVVCVPTTNGKQSGTPSKIAGAVTTGTMWTGTGQFVAPSGTATPAYGAYGEYAYGPNSNSSAGVYPFKVCCGNGTTSDCGHNS
jgi:hypothetical protein